LLCNKENKKLESKQHKQISLLRSEEEEEEARPERLVSNEIGTAVFQPDITHPGRHSASPELEGRVGGEWFFHRRLLFFPSPRIT
jgi:hypothetical protein